MLSNQGRRHEGERTSRVAGLEEGFLLVQGEEKLRM